MIAQTQITLGKPVTLHTDFNIAQERVTQALKTEGFGVLTEIDVKETMKKKLNVDLLPYKILGACNPSLAYQALSATPEVGLLLPCNVTLAQTEDGNIRVAFVDPLAMLSVVDKPELKAVAEEARARLERVAIALSQG